MSQIATYIYDANGTKLRNIGSDGTWDYIDGVVYHNSAIEFVATEEGKAVPNGGSYTYRYNLKDHLGNVRVTFDKNTSTGQAEVLQEDEYYSFGLRHGLYDNSNGNRYLYNGKEIQTDLASQYDYGARFYDPVIGRWTSVDPSSEKSRRWSPYNYAINNPLRYIDPDGREIINESDRVKYTENDAKLLFSAIQQQAQSKEGLKGVHLVNESETPTIYKNTLDAFRKGKPNVLHYAPSLTDINRKDALTTDYPAVSRSVQRDEYPYASTLEGGFGALVYYVPGRENSIQGGRLKALYATLKPTDAFLVLPVPKDKEPDEEKQPVPEPKPKLSPVALAIGVAAAIVINIINSLTKSPAY